MASQSEKERILGRVREALKTKTDPHVRQSSQHQQTRLPVLDAVTSADGSHAFLPPVGCSVDDRIGLFAELSERLQTRFQVVDSIEAASSLVGEISNEENWTRIAFHANELTRPVIDQLSAEKLSTDQPYDARELEQCDAGISGCDALIAQTASVLVTNSSAGGRALSVLPPHHVVIASSTQMLGSMIEGYQLLGQQFGDSNWPSFISFITGPSRTADVERVLVLGAHGPKKLSVILIREQ